MSDKQVLKIIDNIGERLDSLEDLMGFLVKSNLRFKKGQRVKFSTKADRNRVTRKKAGVSVRGRVVEVFDNFQVKVLLDGHKYPQTFHHAFFEKAGRK